MENNNRETKDYQQPISPLEYLNKRKEKKRETKIWIYFGLFWSSWSSEFMSVSLLVTRYTRI